MRGNQPQIAWYPETVRTIPACAGEPWCNIAINCTNSDYPRVCGGTVVICKLINHGQGLSPRVRGNHQPDLSATTHSGTIPACAGEPCPDLGVLSSHGDYPRVCGGTCDIGHLTSIILGLSPRVRGNPIPAQITIAILGTIPACAGEPFLVGLQPVASRDYPRVCGGTCPAPVKLFLNAGLSPRVRGNLYETNELPMAERTIPACAGEPALDPGYLDL